MCVYCCYLLNLSRQFLLLSVFNMCINRKIKSKINKQILTQPSRVSVASFYCCRSLRTLATLSSNCAASLPSTAEYTTIQTTYKHVLLLAFDSAQHKMSGSSINFTHINSAICRFPAGQNFIYTEM